MVWYGPQIGEGEHQKFLTLHKGDCDRAYKAEGHPDSGGWSELSHFLFRLCANAGMSKLFRKQRKALTD